MHRWSLILAVALSVAACTTGAGTSPDSTGGSPPPSEETSTDGGTRVEIISLDHAPIRPFTAEVLEITGSYGTAVQTVSYDFDSPEGKAFAERMGVTEHTPIAIFINGQVEFDVDGRTVAFLSFPQGEGTSVVADGTWTMDDLRTVLDETTG
ncbi:MAG: hypothetical protein WEE36_11040 [Acidimicrobiia bacterium]